MIHLNESRETPDWMPRAAHCRVCGSDDWHARCEPLEVPANITLGGAGD